MTKRAWLPSVEGVNQIGRVKSGLGQKQHVDPERRHQPSQVCAEGWRTHCPGGRLISPQVPKQDREHRLPTFSVPSNQSRNGSVKLGTTPPPSRMSASLHGTWMIAQFLLSLFQPAGRGTRRELAVPVHFGGAAALSSPS